MHKNSILPLLTFQKKLCTIELQYHCCSIYGQVSLPVRFHPIKQEQLMSQKQNYQITAWCQRMMREHIHEGSLCIDATMGNGNDTQFLCEQAGASGRVLAFDIQPAALEHTKERLQKALPCCNYQLILDSHEHLDAYVRPESADCIAFNLGYLPGGNHTLATKPGSTLIALKKSLALLKKDGLLCICIYSGGDTGFAERDAVLDWLKALDSKKYLVLLTQYYNRPNNPPIPAFVIRL